MDTRGVGNDETGAIKVACTITNPSGARTDNYIKPQHDGTYKINYSPFEGSLFFHNLMMIHVLPVLLIHSLSLSLLPCYFRSEGRHVIDIFYDGIPIPGSPFAVNVRRGCDSKKVKAFGQGLVRGIVNQPNVFTIETRGMLSLYRISG